MQYKINKSYILSHYLIIFILLKFYADFLQKLRKIERVYNIDNNHNLEKITDPRGAASDSPVLTVTYDGEDKVDKQRFIEMDADIDFTIGNSSTTVTDARGNPKIFNFPADTRLEVTNGGHTFKYEFNDDRLVTKIEFPGGNSVTYDYYPAAEEKRRSAGNLESVVRSGSDGSITTTYKYETYWSQVEGIIDPKGNETKITHDGNGNIDTVTLPGIEQPYDYDYYPPGEPRICGVLKSITDPMGSVTEYTYYPESSPSGDGVQPVFGRDPNSTIGGYLQSIVIDKGGDNISQSFQYDQLGNITKKTDGEGVLTTYDYDNPFGEVSTLIQGASQSEDGQPQINLLTTFDYDKNGNITGQTSRGITTEYEYDRLNRLRFKRYKGVSGEGEIVQEYELKYDNNSNLKEVIYPRGNKDIYTYDHRDLLQDKSAGNGLTTESYTYTPNGYLHTFTDGENKVYTYVHDSQGRLKDIVDPLGNKVSYGYDENSNLTTLDAFNSNGPSLNLSYVYDPLNRLTHQKIQKESGFINTQYGYNDTAGYLEKIITPNNHQWGITPTGSGSIKSVTDPIGNIDTRTYDKRGWLKTITETEPGQDENGLVNNVTNNVIGNPVLTGDSIGRDYNYIYHHQKQVLSTVKDPEGGVVSYEYDPLGRLWKVIRHETYNGENKEYTTTYTYDLNNNLKTITDAKENVTTYDYDSKDRLWKVTYPGNIIEWVTYDGNDQIKTYTDMNGTVVTNAYDDAGRLERRDVTPASSIEGTTYESFKYDGLGRVISASNNDSTVDFIYDKAGRIEKEIHTFKDSSEEGEVIIAAYDVKKEYDDNGNVVQLTYPSGKIVDITPDSLDRISTIKSSNQLIASYQYEGKGKVVERNFKNKIKVETHYEEGRRPETTTHKTIPEENIIFKKTTKWNKLNLKTSEDKNEEKKTYEYDVAQRLRKETAKDIETEKLKKETEFTIDGIENIDTKKETRKEVTESTTYEYNIRHQLTKVNNIPLTYDNNGNLTKYKHEYVYDWKNRLKKVITGEGINIEYFYDVFGRRIKKVTTAPDGSVTRYFVYNNWQVIEESDESGDIKSRYSYGNKIDERVEIEKSNSPLVSYIPMCDSLGTVMGLADSNGEVVEKIKYSTYGAPIFIYDNTAPEVDVVRTESGNIVIRFSKSISNDSAGNSIKIKQGTSEIPGNLTYSDEDMLVTFTPSNALPQDGTLTVNITTNLEDTFKNKLAVEFNQDFIYQGADLIIFDRQGPIVEDVIKKSGKFTVTFNEEIDISSITDSIDLISSQETFSGTITMDDNKSLTFNPSEALSNGVEYTLNVKTIIRDLSGKNLANVFSQVFVNTTQDQILREKPEPSEHNESRIGNTYLFHGRTYDPVTGLYYYRARYLHPELGRFLQTDPMGYEDSMNMYQAFNQNPVNFVDPMGLRRIRKFKYMGVNYIANVPELWEIKMGRLDFSFKAVDDKGKPILRRFWLFGKTKFKFPGEWEDEFYFSQAQAEEELFRAKGINLGLFKISSPLSREFLGRIYGFSIDSFSISSGKLYLRSLKRNAPQIAISIVAGYTMMASANMANNATKLIKFNSKAKKFYDAKTGRFIKFSEVPWPKRFGFVKMKKGQAEVGQIIDRYGSEGGKYLAPEGVPYEMRGIPQGYSEYHKYKVLKSFEWHEGWTAPVSEFGSPGGGYQYMTKKPVWKLVQEGYLKEI